MLPTIPESFLRTRKKEDREHNRYQCSLVAFLQCNIFLLGYKLKNNFAKNCNATIFATKVGRLLRMCRLYLMI